MGLSGRSFGRNEGEKGRGGDGEMKRRGENEKMRSGEYEKRRKEVGRRKYVVSRLTLNLEQIRK